MAPFCNFIYKIQTTTPDIMHSTIVFNGKRCTNKKYSRSILQYLKNIELISYHNLNVVLTHLLYTSPDLKKKCKQYYYQIHNIPIFIFLFFNLARNPASLLNYTLMCMFNKIFKAIEGKITCKNNSVFYF